jgi:RNA polymerase sigma-70 factor (ECF subfamily)
VNEAADERALASRAVAGDAAALDALAAALIPRLHRWLVASGSRPSDADDIVQDACVRAVRAIATYDSRWSFSTWLFAIAQRVRIDHAARRRALPLAAAGDPEAPRHGETEADAVAAGGLWRLARESLDPDDVRLLWLHYAEEQPPAALARILGINPIAARVRLHRARRRLAAAARTDPAFITGGIAS